MKDRSKKLVIITGSAGRIGANIAQRLGKKYQIVGFELMKAIYASANEELVPLDISSEESIHQAFRHIRAFYGNKIASVIHLAAYYSFEDQHYSNYNKITVQGTKNLLKALQGFEVEQFIFSSTMLVKKATKPGEIITEESPLDGNWAYPQSKIETEEVIRKHRGNIPSVVMQIANQIQRIYEKSLTSHFFPGDSSHGASFIHMDDLVNLLEKAVDMRNEIPKEVTVLVGEEKTLSTKYLQNTISQYFFHKNSRLLWIPKWFAWMGAFVQCHTPFMKKPFIRPWMIKLADEHYELDVSKAKHLFKWEIKHSLKNSLPMMLKDLESDPISWYKKNNLKMPKHMQKMVLKRIKIGKAA